MDENHISSALQAGALAAVAASTLPALPVKYVGRSFETPNDGKWLELIQLPNNLPSQYWGEESLYRGIFRLILHWPVDESGAIPALTLIGSIADFFTKDKMLAAGSVIVKITEKPDLTGLIETSGTMIFPVSVRYQCFQL